MENRDERLQEILRHLKANEELFGTVEAGFDPAEEERQRKIENEIEEELEIDRGWCARRFGAGG